MAESLESGLGNIGSDSAYAAEGPGSGRGGDVEGLRLWFMPDSSLWRRLSNESSDALRELSRDPRSYLRLALLPDRFGELLPARIAVESWGALVAFVSGPFSYVSRVASVEPLGARPRRQLAPIGAVSAAIHGTLIAYLIYTALASPFSSLRIVSKAYKPYEVVELAPLRYPPGMLAPSTEQVLDLEEIKRREQERREREEREAREKATDEEEKPEQVEVARAGAGEEGSEEQQETGESASDFGEINVAPIKDIIGRTYSQYRDGGIDLEVMNFSIMAAFEIERDGSLSGVRIIKSSGSRIIDNQARAIMHAISESHALTPIADLSSNTIQLELTDRIARLTITGFAPSSRDADIKARNLQVVLWGARLAQQSKDPDAAELLGLLKIRSDSRRIDAEMMVSRDRATEMMRARFGGVANSIPR